jgi:hypothetical protein
MLGLGLVLTAAAINHIWLAASPVVPGYVWPRPGGREAAVQAILASIPPTASVAATSAIYPHVASRELAYWFPAVSDAEYVAIDATSSASPIGPREARDRVDALVTAGDYRLVGLAPGFLLLQRNLLPSDAATDFEPPDGFYDFAREPALPATATRLATTFGDSLMLDGYVVEKRSTQTIFGADAIVTTYWHASAPIRDHLRFAFYVTRRLDGALAGELADAAPEPIWYPPYLWRSADIVHLRVDVPRSDELQAIGVAVVGDTGARLPIYAPTGAALWENSTIARITRFDRG